MSYQVRVWDPKIKAWVLYRDAFNEERAKEIGRTLWRQGAAGIKITVMEQRVIVEKMR